MADKLTEAMIAAGMARAERVACQENARCFALPDPLGKAHTTCTPKGRCKIGWIIAEGGRTSYDAWIDIHTGEARLRRQHP
jgi:hypothetical protein